MLMLRKTKPSLLYRLLSGKESYDTECYYKKMNDLIEHDLDQFEFYDELAEKENEYTDAPLLYKVVVKDKHTSTWRVYFLGEDYPVVVYPLNEGGIIMNYMVDVAFIIMEWKHLNVADSISNMIACHSLATILLNGSSNMISTLQIGLLSILKMVILIVTAQKNILPN